jgi:hypothetical protein
MYINYRKINLCLLAAAMLLLSCNEDGLLPPANTKAYISFINTSPFLDNNGAARVAVETNGHIDTNELRVLYSNIYPEPNKYVPFEEGTCKVSFKDPTRSALVTGGITTRAGAYYSAILADSMDNYSAVIVQDDYEAVTDKALVRIMHFSPDAGEISLFRDTVRQETFGNMRYKQVTPYIPLNPGANFSFILRRNDGTNKRVGRFFVPGILANGAYTILLKGYVDPPDGDIANKSSQIVFYRN